MRVRAWRPERAKEVHEAKAKPWSSGSAARGAPCRRFRREPGRLVHFGSTGERLSGYDPSAAATDAICDAYALCAAADGSVWVSFYTEFPIVRVTDGAYKVWNPGVPGACAMAVEEPRVLLFGDYQRDSLARVVELGPTGSSSVMLEREVVDEAGQPLGQAQAYGAGRDLYLFRERRVLVVRDW